MRRIRRKPRVLWLPVHGRDFSLAAETKAFGNGIGGELQVPNDGTFGDDIQAVTFDYSDSASAEEGTDFRSLHELSSGNAYRLRRIVGKFHAAALINDTESTTGIPLVQLGAGFMVRRTDDSGNLNTVFTPGGSPNGPLHQDSAGDPWIWRRTWFLSTIPPQMVDASGTGAITAEKLEALAALTGGGGIFPHTTAHYGSVQDGPHIDQKTARIIGPEERLFFSVQARIVNQDGNVRTASVNWNLDLRILGSLRTQVGNRRNASR